MALTSLLLTLWSTTLLRATKRPTPTSSSPSSAATPPGPGGRSRSPSPARCCSIFASNTAIIGNYHVFLALSRMRFSPAVIERRNRRRGTPHWAILAATGVPILILVGARGDVNLLGDLYAFGLLGAFSVTCLCLDIVRWRERAYRSSRKGQAFFVLGIVTTLLVMIAWLTNLVAKPQATIFGGGLTILGLLVGITTYYVSRSREPIVFPFMAPSRPAGGADRHRARALPHCDVLAILPHDTSAAEAVVAAATRAAADDQRLVFLYRGEAPDAREAELLEVTDPYLGDRAAQVAFGRAERAARKATRHRRYVYVPGNLRPDVVGEV